MKTLTGTSRLLLNWRLSLFLVAVLGMWLIPFKEEFNLARYEGNWLSPFVTWANFDGEHYLSLAQTGYRDAALYTQAFFPLYPKLISGLASLGFSLYFAGLLVSHISIFLAIWLLYKLVSLDLSASATRWTIYVLLLFPTAYFFGSVYTESLFLLLSVAAIWFARKHQWALAAIAAGLASATRVTGILVSLVVIIEYLQAYDFNWRRIFHPRGLWLLLTPSGLLGYMWYLQKNFGDALYFLHVQPFFGAQRLGEKVILLHQVFYRYGRMMIFVDHTSTVFLVALIELLVAIVFLWLILWVWKLRKSYFVYAALSFILPTLTGTFSSLPRYVLVIFPAFMILGQWLSKANTRIQWAYVLISTILLSLLTMMFTRGYFIA